MLVHNKNGMTDLKGQTYVAEMLHNSVILYMLNSSNREARIRNNYEKGENDKKDERTLFPKRLITFRQRGSSIRSSQCDQREIINNHVLHLLMRAGTWSTSEPGLSQP